MTLFCPLAFLNSHQHHENRTSTVHQADSSSLLFSQQTHKHRWSGSDFPQCSGSRKAAVPLPSLCSCCPHNCPHSSGSPQAADTGSQTLRHGQTDWFTGLWPQTLFSLFFQIRHSSRFPQLLSSHDKKMTVQGPSLLYQGPSTFSGLSQKLAVIFPPLPSRSKFPNLTPLDSAIACLA